MEDILSDRRTRGDLCWVLKPCDQEAGEFSSKLLPTSLLDCIKNDPGVMAELVQMSPAEQQQARQKIDDIFIEMHHNFNIGSIRRVGFSLAKIFKQLYDHINVELAGIEQVRALPPGVPTLYLPTHRSYVDFLLVSYVCFHYRLPLPVIAAGMDFKSMMCVGDILRNCGAFFIRRRLAGDRLYTAVLRAYVQSLALSSAQPTEFFIEGTRSRSGKPLPPRSGLLSAYLELFRTGRIPDLHIVPVSISYERVLEENLYAYEMLGTPKPPESTGRLVGAVSVLAENYGSVHVRLLGIHSLRSGAGGAPRGCELAAAVLRRQVAGGRLSAGCLLLAALQLAGGRQQLPQLLQLAGFIGRQLCAARPQLSVEEVDADSVKRAFHVHHNLLRVSASRLVDLKPPAQPAKKLHRPTEGPRLQERTVTAMVPRIQLQFYINPLLPHIAGPALTHLADSADVRRLLFDLMSVEFPTLERCDAETELPSADARWQDVTTQLIRPYLEAYRVVISAILAALPEEVTTGRVQLWAEQHYDTQLPAGHLCLCKDVIANCTTALIRLGAGTRTNGSGGCGRGAAQWRRDRLQTVAAALDRVGPPTGRQTPAKL